MAESVQGRIRVLSEASTAILGPDFPKQTQDLSGVACGWRSDANLTAFRCDGEAENARDCEIIFPQSVYQQVVEHLSEDVTREYGGFLLGHETFIGESNRPAVIIERAVPAQYTEGTGVRLTFSMDSWRDLDQITDSLRQAGRRTQRVGWYHSHPALSIFLSHWDLDVCKTFDRRRYPVALVVDPVGRLGGFFVRGKEGYRPQYPQGFHELHDLQPESVVTWTNVLSIGAVERPDERPGEPTKPIHVDIPATNLPQSEAGPVPPVTTDRTPLNVATNSKRHREERAWFEGRIALATLFLMVIAGFVFLYIQQRDISRRLDQLATDLSAMQGVSISPGSASLLAAQSQTFKAAVDGRDDLAVRWSIAPDVGTISPAGVYTAPALISSAETVTITATSQDDSNRLGSATVRLSPAAAVVSVMLNPQSSELAQGQRQEFKTTVTGSDNDEVVWSIAPAVGTISADGIYSAPAVVPARQAVTVTATSKAQPDKSATAVVNLKPPVQQPAPPQVSVTVEPNQVTLGAGGVRKFTAQVTGASGTVTWTLEGDGEIGEISKTGDYTGPTQVSQSKTVRVKAASSADVKKFGIATITLEPPKGDGSSPNQP